MCEENYVSNDRDWEIFDTKGVQLRQFASANCEAPGTYLSWVEKNHQPSKQALYQHCLFLIPEREIINPIGADRIELSQSPCRAPLIPKREWLRYQNELNAWLTNLSARDIERHLTCSKDVLRRTTESHLIREESSGIIGKMYTTNSCMLEKTGVTRHRDSMNAKNDIRKGAICLQAIAEDIATFLNFILTLKANLCIEAIFNYFICSINHWKYVPSRIGRDVLYSQKLNYLNKL
ncbi:MAG: hypothetical protein ACK4KT_05175 [Thermaurantimonas sp.]